MSPFPKNKWYRQLANGVSPRAFVVGFVLVENFLFRNQTDCWATQQTIARLANASPRTVRDALKELEDRGFLTHRRGGKGHANRYVPVLFDRQDLAYQNEEETAFDRQDFACDERQDPAAELTVHSPEGGAPRATPILQAPVSNEVETLVAAPDAPVGAGADEATELEDRVDALENDLEEHRDPESGLYDPSLPRSVLAFCNRETDPVQSELVLIESAYRQWKTGDFVEPATDDELLLEYARRAALPYRADPDESSDGAVDLAQISEPNGRISNG